MPRSPSSKRTRNSNSCKTRAPAKAEAAKRKVEWQYPKMEIQKKLELKMKECEIEEMCISRKYPDPYHRGNFKLDPQTPSEFPFVQGNVNPSPLWNFHRNITHPPYALESFLIDWH